MSGFGTGRWGSYYAFVIFLKNLLHIATTINRVPELRDFGDAGAYKQIANAMKQTLFC